MFCEIRCSVANVASIKLFDLMIRNGQLLQC